MSKGPLSGYKFIEIAGVGPTQVCGMLLGDMGAQVIRVERLNKVQLGVTVSHEYELWNRSRQSIAVDLKTEEGKEIVLRLCQQADALYEGFRPGVMERLGLGPDECTQQNPKLIYGRMTGWGQTGPLAKAAGHDPNYIAITGVLDAVGERDGPPVIPLNLVGDYAGGAMYLAMGLLAALLETNKSGQGQVIDCAMVDGVNSLMTQYYGKLAAGVWEEKRGHNILDGGAHFFSVYKTQDDKYIVIGPIEERFYKQLIEKLGITEPEFEDQSNTEQWPQLKQKLQVIFSTKTQTQWCELLEGTDCCFSPVLSLTEATKHPHIQARGNFITVAGIEQPAPAPRFDRTPGEIQSPPVAAGNDTKTVLEQHDFSLTEIQDLLDKGVIKQL